LWTVSGEDVISERLRMGAGRMGPRGFVLAEGRTPPRRVMRTGTEAIEVIFAFDTQVGPGTGVVRLVGEASDAGAWTLMTRLDEIRGHEDPAYGTRWRDVDWKRNFCGETLANLLARPGAAMAEMGARRTPLRHGQRQGGGHHRPRRPAAC
jgi:hypothetical protein